MKLLFQIYFFARVYCYLIFKFKLLKQIKIEMKFETQLVQYEFHNLNQMM